MEIFPGISMDPGIGFGKPCLTGTRIDVATVVGALAAGESVEAVQEAYAMTREQILAALRYAAHVAEHVPRWSSQLLEDFGWIGMSCCRSIIGSGQRDMMLSASSSLVNERSTIQSFANGW